MCDSHQPLNGADSEPLTFDQAWDQMVDDLEERTLTTDGRTCSFCGTIHPSRRLKEEAQ